MAANGSTRLMRWAVGLFAGAYAVDASIYDVRGGSRAVIFDRLSGVQDKVANEGTHFLIPWLQRSIIYDVRTKPRNISTTTGSKDLQMVSLTLRVLHRPDVPKLPIIYQVCPSSLSLIQSSFRSPLCSPLAASFLPQV
ncbi:prohibitin subunit PHB1 [Aspergillus melleus]|uniref:prohibitin subunit PHB1 n=1 Tax=Aspergillus melleus TaxID=138277 RepID=UPI001E8E139C|nr:Prohibitin-1, subunit of the prohibitin complex (Phb1p-Phb2p) [Aspergillus melleus]KAH8426279.1 Prohibitin-1, subunit of the prohibitin complex (Phb1p-Phb2p) [Aspergillus melleus]